MNSTIAIKMRRQVRRPSLLLELYFKDDIELGKLASNVLQPMSHLLSGVVLTFKTKKSLEENPAAAAQLTSAFPQIAVHAVWSSKIAYVGTGKRARGAFDTRQDATFNTLTTYAKGLMASSPQIQSILLVSGTGQKKSLCSVECLRQVSSDLRETCGIHVGCAFNPALGGSLDPDPDSEGAIERERSRLRSKLMSGRVSTVWINFSADVAAVREGLGYLKCLEAELKDSITTPLRLIGSIFVPSTSWLAKMRFRCWSGCFLGPKTSSDSDSSDYLSSVDAATRITSDLLKVYQSYGVEPLVESSVRTRREAEECVSFLRSVGMLQHDDCLQSDAS